MRSQKATQPQLRAQNRQLALQALRAGLARSRADLAAFTGLAKSTISDVVDGLVSDGYLIESGLGDSTAEGGKRPRLLEFAPNARQVIGMSLEAEQIIGILANLEGHISFEHRLNLDPRILNVPDAIFEALLEAVNGLLAQLSAPLLAVGVGVPGIVNPDHGTVIRCPQLSWQDYPLGDKLSHALSLPCTVGNNTELAALGQYAYHAPAKARSLAVLMLGDTIGVGFTFAESQYHQGYDLSQARLGRDDEPLQARLSHSVLQSQMATIAAAYSPLLPDEPLGYWHLRAALAAQDPAAQRFCAALAKEIAHLAAWMIALNRPDHLSLLGDVAQLGESFLELLQQEMAGWLPHYMLDDLTFSVQESGQWAPLGAAAKAIQTILGIL